MQNRVTLKDLPSLTKAYNKAVKEGKTQFTYKGNELLVSYAKYLIEYMNTLNN